jgi:thiosulfate/3-mercaptopyruvate sulfurtransferase
VKRRARRLTISAVCFSILAVSTICYAADSDAHREMLVSTTWLANHLNDASVVVLQVGHDRRDYEKEHIPGARFLDTDDFTTGHTGLMVELPTVEKLKQAFEGLGVSDNSRVVIYTVDWYPVAGRAFFTFDYFGHTNTALLDGSLAQWKAENRPVTTDEPKVIKGSVTPHVDGSVLALLADAKAASQVGSPTILLDSRPKRRYVAGHLPKADHIFWEETVANANKPVFLPPEELRKLFASRGITPGHRLITYCEIGLQASHLYFVAKYLGYDVAMFDGSFYQWNDVEHLASVKGNSPQ